ncbi:hypothetical protein RF11_12996 [Thelohanellus kitauei]|uniref:Fibronectin type-III domain-containing protein n=1 Tax=Thelohanellus kitauei TaxID=669202 RepID=A0A0C2JAI2_THEKT|nr:hypothetical protein RF11_12996 [Thelohanellus kitauei]
MNLLNKQNVPENFTNFHMLYIRESIIICGVWGCEPITNYNVLFSYNTKSGVCKRYQPPIDITKPYLSTITCDDGNTIYICTIKNVDNSIGNHQICSLISFDVNYVIWEILYSHVEVNADNQPVLMDIRFFLFQ